MFYDKWQLNTLIEEPYVFEVLIETAVYRYGAVVLNGLVTQDMEAILVVDDYLDTVDDDDGNPIHFLDVGNVYALSDVLALAALVYGYKISMEIIRISPEFYIEDAEEYGTVRPSLGF